MATKHSAARDAVTRRGITLLEICVVLAATAIVAATALPSRRDVIRAADASCWIVHTGAAADCRCADVESVACRAPATRIKGVVLPNVGRVGVAANVASIVFDPCTARTPTGTLRLVVRVAARSITSIGAGRDDRHACRFVDAPDGGSFGATIAHSVELADIDRALVAENFLVVPGSEPCLRGPPTEPHQP